MEPLVLFLSRRLPRHASHQLSNEHKINDQWSCQKRIFADVKQTNSLVASKEDFCIVFVQGPLVVAYCWHILDHHGMVRMLAWLVQHRVGLHHIVDNVGFGDLLGAELSLRAQIFAIIIAQMVIACDGSKLDASADQEINKGRFHLGLSRLEVITANKRSMLLRKFNCSRHKGILGRSVDEGDLLENASDGENG